MTRGKIATSALYITGTDTGVGKTLASCALLHALRGRGLRAVGMKPVASGCMLTPQGWRNQDARMLQAASDPRPDYADLNPYALPQPLAPEIAAAEAGTEIGLEHLLAAYGRLRKIAETVVVEGVGGWSAPLSATLDQADLVRVLDCPVVLVVGLRLGCLNHARISAAAIRADGCRLAGWIANEIDADMTHRDQNMAILARHLQSPCLGRLPHRIPTDPAAMAQYLVATAAIASQ